MTTTNYEQTTIDLFNQIMTGIKNGTITPEIQAKCVCVDATPVTPEMAGEKHIVWSHGKIEKIVTLKEGQMLLTTLDRNGNPIVDEQGHQNTYDMDIEKFGKKYPQQINGHYAQDGTPMLTVALPDDIVPQDGITMLPPNWKGSEVP